MVDEKINCGCYPSIPSCGDVNYIVERDNIIQW